MIRLAIAIALIGMLIGAPRGFAESGDQWREQRGIALPVTVERDGLVVRAERGMEPIAERIASSAASELADIAVDLVGLPTPETVEIRLVEQTASLGRAAPHPGVPEWAVGVAFSHWGVVVAAQRRKNELLDIDNTVAHELAHLALGAALGGRAPRWLNEGFAYLHSSDWSYARFRTLVGMAWSRDIIPLYDLDRSFPAGENEAHRAYAQSYDFVAFLARRGRYKDTDDDGNPLPFRRFLRALGKGQTPNEAALHAYGASLNDLFDEWRDGLRSRYLLVPAEMFGLFVWILGALLLVIGYIRSKRKNRATIARWDEEDLQRAEAPSTTDP